MAYTGEFKVYEDIIEEMSVVYQHDKRPWMIGFSGGKDSTLLCCLVMEMLQRLPAEKRNKTVYIVSSDTMVENPIVRDYMHRMSDMINKTGAELNIKADNKLINSNTFKDTYLHEIDESVLKGFTKSSDSSLIEKELIKK